MLGDAIERALHAVGITPEGVERWLGGPCGCKERQQKMNALHAWASRVLAGRVGRAQEYLSGIMGAETTVANGNAVEQREPGGPEISLG